MKNTLLMLQDKIIEYGFYLLFFLVPLILTPFNYELFEYNKMMLTYGLTAVIVGSWIIKTILLGKIRFKRTILDIPLMLFLGSQIISTIFSLDRHVSLFGYYSRFNGGLFSTISYFLLYFAFINNFPREKIKKLLIIILTAGLLVSIYGILEHFGIDKNLWVQDVQNRVFSTLGQPNWLAAYLAVLLSLTLGLTLYYLTKQNTDTEEKIQSAKLEVQSAKNIKSPFIIALLHCLIIVFYTSLLFTKSRSGFIGFWIANIAFWSLLFLKLKEQAFKSFFIINSFFLILTFIFGSPLLQINRFTLPELMKNNQSSNNNNQAPVNTGSSIIDIGITESGTIRKIVWKGAVDIFLNNPIIGTGVETFAFAYYQYRPPEHNMTSEWDFLYNKAHNEYLNFAATTGILGIGSYLLIIAGFIWWNIIKFKDKNVKIKVTVQKSKISENQKISLPCNFALYTLNFALFCAWLSILITNFFGFSVVVIQLFFFLIPAIFFLLQENLEYEQSLLSQTKSINEQMKQDNNISMLQITMIIIVLLSTIYFLFSILRLWYADTLFASGYHASRGQDYTSAYQSLKEAIRVNDKEPLYFDELSYPAAMLSLALFEDKQSTLSGKLAEEAIAASDIATTISPNNVNYLKTRTRVFYVLDQIDPKYLEEALLSLEKARLLSPTDPKISYNLAALYDQKGKKEEAKKLLEETTKLKPDYRDAYLALGLHYFRDNNKEKAKEMLEFILTRIATDDADAKALLKEIK